MLRSILTVLVALSPYTALAAPENFKALSELITNLLGGVTGVLVIAGLVVYFYGVSTNILNFSDKSGEKLRGYFVWGVIILFVMFSIWGILALLQNTLFRSDQFMFT